MIKKQTQQPNRDGILGALTRFGRGKVAPLSVNDGKGYSRKHRKSITTWQNQTVLKELYDILQISRMSAVSLSRSCSRKG